MGEKGDWREGENEIRTLRVKESVLTKKIHIKKRVGSLGMECSLKPAGSFF